MIVIIILVVFSKLIFSPFDYVALKIITSWTTKIGHFSALTLSSKKNILGKYHGLVTRGSKCAFFESKITFQIFLVFDSEPWPDVLHYFSSLPYGNMGINYQFLHFQQTRGEIRDNGHHFRNNHHEVQALLVSIQTLPPLNQVMWPNHVARPTHANLYCHHQPLYDPLIRLRFVALVCHLVARCRWKLNSACLSKIILAHKTRKKYGKI